MKITITNIPPALNPDEAVPILREELQKATLQVGSECRKSVILAIDETKPHAPVDENTMRGGVVFVPTEPLSGVVTVTPLSQPYAVVQELGRRPGQPGPPLAPILSWVLRKGIASGKDAKRAAFLIRRKLHVKGMTGRHFFKRGRSRKAAHVKALALVKAALRRFARRVT